jgi:hypothetical protein
LRKQACLLSLKILPAEYLQGQAQTLRIRLLRLQFGQLFIDARYSKWDVYEAVSDFNIQRFYAAARRRDDKEANVVIGATVALLNAIVQSTEPVVENYPKRKKAQREMQGVNAHYPSKSKL